MQIVREQKKLTFDQRHELERQRDALRNAVLHQVELAVGRHERDGLLRRELGQVDALVKL